MATQSPENSKAGAKPGSREAPYSVSRVVVGVNRQFERAVGTIWVEGEVASLSHPASGHLYFSLVDAKAELRAVMWRSDAARLKFKLKDGMTLRAMVRLGLYEQGGRFQLYVKAAEPAGVGADALALAQLRAKLAAEGLFDVAKKRPLPLLPKRIGIVTSRTGAAVRDIVRAVQRRYPVPMLIAHAQVQGQSAAREITAALSSIAASGVDVVIVGRGGGSAVDLSAFNDERVVRAIARCAIPVISAVGHEVDVSLTDLAADVRAATPTMAGEMAVPVLSDLAESISLLERRAARELRHHVDSARGRLETLATRTDRAIGGVITGRRAIIARAHRSLSAAHPRTKLVVARAQLESLAERLSARVEAQLTARRSALGAAAGKLDAMSPLRVLERGYAIAEHRSGVVTDATAVAIGDPLTVRVRRGELQCVVESISKGAGDAEAK